MSFHDGEKVFGKLQGYPPWPARICNKKSNDQYLVKFYPKGDKATLKPKAIHSFYDYLPKMKKIKKTKSFESALEAFFNDFTEMELVKVISIDQNKVFLNYYAHLLDEDPQNIIANNDKNHDGHYETEINPPAMKKTKQKRQIKKLCNIPPNNVGHNKASLRETRFRRKQCIEDEKFQRDVEMSCDDDFLSRPSDKDPSSRLSNNDPRSKVSNDPMPKSYGDDLTPSTSYDHLMPTANDHSRLPTSVIVNPTPTINNEDPTPSTSNNPSPMPNEDDPIPSTGKDDPAPSTCNDDSLPQPPDGGYIMPLFGRIGNVRVSQEFIGIFETFAELVAINYYLKTSLRYGKIPNFKRCLSALEILMHIKVTAPILITFPSIVETVVKIRHYHVKKDGYPKSIRQLLKQQGEIIRAKAAQVISHFQEIRLSDEDRYDDGYETESAFEFLSEGSIG